MRTSTLSLSGFIYTDIYIYIYIYIYMCVCVCMQVYIYLIDSPVNLDGPGEMDKLSPFWMNNFAYVLCSFSSFCLLWSWKLSLRKQHHDEIYSSRNLKTACSTVDIHAGSDNTNISHCLGVPRKTRFRFILMKTKYSVHMMMFTVVTSDSDVMLPFISTQRPTLSVWRRKCCPGSNGRLTEDVLSGNMALCYAT